MGVHHISWHATASGLEDEVMIADALAWLCGDREAVTLESTTSYHGSAITMVSAEITRKGPATKSIARLGPDVIADLASQLDSRMDEDNVIHIRLDLLDLLAGVITLSLPGERATIKGRTKLQVYPGDDAAEVAASTLDSARNDALRLRLPENPIEG